MTRTGTNPIPKTRAGRPDAFTRVGLKGLPDFAQAGVLAKAKAMTDHVTQALDSIDSRIAGASRLLKGDISVILQHGSDGKNVVEAIQRMWRAGRRTTYHAATLTQATAGAPKASLIRG
ncbi:hypothetical protein BA171_01525 [Candidatus Hamiltonella defensa (Bemisia tabaci)]|uniref:Uncharacterized protein n=2 Tax=Candidatus Williamhamiltonella defendens TaxID=138072 RepID=A0A249DY76_9ENTR|nr:hypothetical protein BA171_01525 [Candidatus Hamiltonella defensa (Bemisia tabaci)]